MNIKKRFILNKSGEEYWIMNIEGETEIFGTIKKEYTKNKNKFVFSLKYFWNKVLQGNKYADTLEEAEDKLKDILAKVNTKVKQYEMKNIKTFENYHSTYEFIGYHSTDFKIENFNFNDIQIKANSSTRIDGIFFSNTPQHSWGEYLYKVKIVSKNPAIFDLKYSRFDSLGIQESFDALLRGDVQYMIDDLVDYGGMEQDDAESLVDKWCDLDLIVIKNEVYANHDIEYIVPDLYNRKSAKIIILDEIN